MQERSCGAVVFRKNKDNKKIEYLLLHYESGHWDFVKGNIEKGEDEKETVARELKEETGITDAKFIDGFREVIKYFYRREKLIRKEVIFYLVETKEKEIKLSFEHIGSKWLTFNDAMKLVTFKNSKDILKIANDILQHKKTKKKNLRDF